MEEINTTFGCNDDTISACATLIHTDENQFRKREARKAELREHIADAQLLNPDFESSFQTAFDFIGNPHKHWACGDLMDKRLTLKLVFARQLPHSRKNGFQTAALSLPFTVTQQLKAGKSEMVHWGGEVRTGFWSLF